MRIASNRSRKLAIVIFFVLVFIGIVVTVNFPDQIGGLVSALGEVLFAMNVASPLLLPPLVFLIFARGIYKTSRNWPLFAAELRLIFVSIFSLHGKASKDKRWEEHREAVAAHNVVRRQELVGKGFEQAELLVSTIWRRHNNDGELTVERSEYAEETCWSGHPFLRAAISFSLENGTPIFSIIVVSKFPRSADQQYSLRCEDSNGSYVLAEETPTLSRLEQPMEKRLSAVIVGKEHEAVGVKLTNKATSE